jgi:protein gp37
MAGPSDIEWTDATWNPVRGCKKVSPGCKYCYAETFAERFRGVPDHPYEQGFDPRLVPDALDAPLHWRKPRTIFVNSMSDLFGDFVPDDYIAAVFGVMAASPRHTFQVLTKRAERLPAWFDWIVPNECDVLWEHAVDRIATTGTSELSASILLEKYPANSAWAWPLPNVWLGVSVEDCKYGLPRIEHLRRTPAAVRFLSIEPLLEDLGALDLSGIHWVIVGGESGPGARRMHPDWVRSIRGQCVAAGVPFFFKQWGGVRKKVAGRELDGRTWDEMPRRVA